MAKAGRKRKDGAKRKPCGKVADRREDRSVASYGRAKDLIDVVASPWLATPLGRKWYLGEVTTDERDAGLRWAEVQDEYRRLVLEAPKGSAKAASFERVDGSHSASEALSDKEREKRHNQRVRRALKRYHSHHEAVGSAGGTKAVKALNKLCVDEEALTYAEWLEAVKGLRALAELMRRGRSQRAA